MADGQCMIIVDQGRIVEVCAEPSEFTYDTSTELSIFAGSLGESIIETFKAIGKRFTYGGDTGKDQRVYYFNTKEILDNKFGTAKPISFRVVDSRINFDVDVSLRCNGTYTFRITDPIKLYTNVTGNVAQSYSKDELRDTMKTEFISALGPALAKLSIPEIRLHNLRHSNATALIQAGVNPRVVQQRLGHSDVNTTLSIYTHVLHEMDKEAAQKIDDIMLKKA